MALCRSAARPVIRFDLGGEEIQVAMGAGLGEWVGPIPLLARNVRIALPPGLPATGFSLTSCEVLSFPKVLALAGRRSVLRTIAAAGLRLLGRRADAVGLLEETLNATPMSRYHEWRTGTERPLDPQGLDASGEGLREGPHLRVLIGAEGGRGREMLAATLASASTLRELVAFRCRRCRIAGRRSAMDVHRGFGQRSTTLGRSRIHGPRPADTRRGYRSRFRAGHPCRFRSFSSRRVALLRGRGLGHHQRAVCRSGTEAGLESDPSERPRLCRPGCLLQAARPRRGGCAFGGGFHAASDVEWVFCARTRTRRAHSACPPHEEGRSLAA